MRFLNVHTLELEEYMPDAIPEFAILSHTWEAGEMKDSNRAAVRDKPGYQKIVKFCEFVKRALPANVTNTWSEHAGTEAVGLDRVVVNHVWVDTCCIDKTSSAELSEAINSMYAGYSLAVFCVAYLSDYPHGYSGYTSSHLQRSRWWTRGWTLQELLAPEIVLFVDKNWHIFGSRASLAAEVAGASGIDSRALAHLDHVFEHNIATRMSWAARRTTTRPEDVACSLMGLFQVNMPLLYGEGGERAFIRLQEEIIKETDDESIFVWNPSAERASSALRLYLGALAIHPSEFVNTGECESLPGPAEEPYAVTNQGIRLRMTTVKPIPNADTDLFAIPRCHNIGSSPPWRYAIPLQLIPGPGTARVYGRNAQPILDCSSISLYSRAEMRHIYLLERTKAVRDQGIPIVQIYLSAMAPRGAVATRNLNLVSDSVRVYTELDSRALHGPRPRWQELVGTWNRSASGFIELGGSGKATVVFVQSTEVGTRPRIEPFALGIEKDPGETSVTVVLKTLGEHAGRVSDQDLPDLHNQLHCLAKSHAAYLEVSLEGEGLRPREQRAVIEAVTEIWEIEDTNYPQRRCTIRLSVSALASQ